MPRPKKHYFTACPLEPSKRLVPACEIIKSASSQPFRPMPVKPFVPPKPPTPKPPNPDPPKPPKPPDPPPPATHGGSGGISPGQIAGLAGGGALIAGGAGDLIRNFNKGTRGADSPADEYGGEFDDSAWCYG